MHGLKEPDNTLSAYLGTMIRSHGLLIKQAQNINPTRLLITENMRKDS
jgi:hypothetical protein